MGSLNFINVGRYCKNVKQTAAFYTLNGKETTDRIVGKHTEEKGNQMSENNKEEIEVQG